MVSAAVGSLKDKRVKVKDKVWRYHRENIILSALVADHCGPLFGFNRQQTTWHLKKRISIR